MQQDAASKEAQRYDAGCPRNANAGLPQNMGTLPQHIRQACDTPAVVHGCRPKVSDEVLILMERHPEADEDVDDEEHMQDEEDVGRQAV